MQNNTTVMLEKGCSTQKTSNRRILHVLMPLCITRTNPSKILRLDGFFMLYPYIIIFSIPDIELQSLCSCEFGSDSQDDEDDFFVVPIPDCFNPALPPTTQASTSVCVKIGE